MKANELKNLVERNIINLHYLGLALRAEADAASGYTRQQTFILVSLWRSGRSKLKDIAKREFTTVPNLCAMFRRLERDGLVLREADTQDKRNAYYSVTDKGIALGEKVQAIFHDKIQSMLRDLNMSAEEKKKLLDASRTVYAALARLDKDDKYRFPRK
jgi:DNA-binding MarR family transcriptional regulator